MLTKEENDLLTRTGPGTPGGDLLRSYWQPVALSRELKADEPLPLTHLGQSLVMFRDAQGSPRLLTRYCPHRGVDLSYGRVEDNGIRCIYHGWLMDGTGKCVERPCEPPHLRTKGNIRIGSFPCHEAAGVILAYVGRGEPPPLPNFHFLSGPAENTFAMKAHQECNYLQGNEGNIDPSHLSFLHRFLPEGVSASMNLRSGALNDVLASDQSPDIRVAETPFGLRINSARAFKEGTRWVRLTNFLMPNAAAIQGSPVLDPRKQPISPNCYYQINWHVPIDDHTHWKYVISHRFDGPVDPEFLMSSYDQVGPDFRVPRTRANRFNQDREEMRKRSFAGLGMSFFVHDKCVIETQGDGPIMDRSTENLGTSDRAIVAMRRLLLKAITDVKEGRDPRMIDRSGETDPLKDLAIYSKEVPNELDLESNWWQEHFHNGRPLLK